MPRTWHVATVRPLQDARAVRELNRQGFFTFAPRCRTRVIKPNGQHRYCVRPYIPGYVFVRTDLKRDPWWRIGSTRGISRLISCGEVPSRVRRGIVEAMLRMCSGGWAVDERQLDELVLQAGDRVRTKNGVDATVMWSAHDRVRIMLELLGKEHQVTVERSFVTPIS